MSARRSVLCLALVCGAAQAAGKPVSEQLVDVVGGER